MRTTSRSVKMPTGHSPESGTSTAPTFSACMVRIASVMLDLAETVTTRRPLPANTSLSFIGASCTRHPTRPARRKRSFAEDLLVRGRQRRRGAPAIGGIVGVDLTQRSRDEFFMLGLGWHRTG